MLTTSHPVKELDIDALEDPSSDALIYDVREPSEFAQGRVPQAVNLPNADLAIRLKDLPRDRLLLVICQRGNRSVRAAQFLVQMGIDSVASIRGGTDQWMKAGKPIEREKDDAEGPLVTDSEWTHAAVLHQS